MVSYFYQNPLILVAILTIAFSPFVLKLASNQGKKTKQNLRSIFIFILSAQIILGFLNWETFKGTGRSGFDLSLAYPGSMLGLFFILSVAQIILLLVSKTFNVLVVVLNFISSVTIFMGMIRLSSILSFQAVSLSSIGAVFLVLTGNVVGLTFINKDSNLLKKYFR